MYKIVDISESEHDEFVLNHKNGDLLQLTGWARSKELTGWYSRRVAVTYEDVLVGVGSLLFKKLPKVKYTMCYISRGFVCDYTDEALVATLLNAAKAVAAKENSYVIKIDPDVERDLNDVESDVVSMLKSLGFKHSGYVDGMSKDNIQPRQTMVTDISVSDKDLMQSFETSNRNKVRRSLRRGTTVIRANREDFPIFKALMDETGKRDGFLTRDLTYFLSIYDSLNPTGNMELFLTKLDPKQLISELNEDLFKVTEKLKKVEAKKDRKKSAAQINELRNQQDSFLKQLEEAKGILNEHPDGIYLAGSMLGISGRKAYYLYSGSSNNYRTYLPNHHLQYEMMRFAREQGAKQYDFGGVSAHADENNTYYGLWQFKRVWGTTVSDKIGEFDYVMNPAVYQLLEKGVPLIQKAKIGLNRVLNRKK